eukprot:NODE_2851_length_1028_cov_5.237998_g2387_i0.p1 GENE.NODE_2851_length_1028_cov_5.237998_g2387_i0~~NODE_2851_length_1028_cov_5.237998_g2387_i0.p1  ORF type:complete len:288 (-),score=24.42 NODE_2851_length_1028_cov_5.237998_g2387_i0:164-1003(-)
MLRKDARRMSFSQMPRSSPEGMPPAMSAGGFDPWHAPDAAYGSKPEPPALPPPPRMDSQLDRYRQPEALDSLGPWPELDAIQDPEPHWGAPQPHGPRAAPNSRESSVLVDPALLQSGGVAASSPLDRRLSAEGALLQRQNSSPIIKRQGSMPPPLLSRKSSAAVLSPSVPMPPPSNGSPDVARSPVEGVSPLEGALSRRDSIRRSPLGKDDSPKLVRRPSQLLALAPSSSGSFRRSPDLSPQVGQSSFPQAGTTLADPALMSGRPRKKSVGRRPSAEPS